MSNKVADAIQSSDTPVGRIWSAWDRFWFQAEDPFGFHCLRAIFGSIALLWLLSYAGHVEAFFSRSGWVDETAANVLSKQQPGSDQVTFPYSPLDLMPNADAIRIWYVVGLVGTALFAAGVATRVTGVIFWLAVFSFTSNPLIRMDGDVLLTFVAFYLLLGSLLMGLSRPEGVLGYALGDGRRWLLPPFFNRNVRPAPSPSLAAHVAIRLFQVHFAGFVLFLMLQKLSIMEWRAGDALWFAFYDPFKTTFESIMEQREGSPTVTLIALSAATYALMAWQLLFPFFAWRAGWRVFFAWTSVIGALVAWFGYGDPFYGLLWIGSCLAFAPAATWRKKAIQWRILSDRAREDDPENAPPLAHESPENAKTVVVTRRS